MDELGYVFTTNEGDWDPGKMHPLPKRSDAVNSAIGRDMRAAPREFWTGALSKCVMRNDRGDYLITHWVKAVGSHTLSPVMGRAVPVGAR